MSANRLGRKEGVVLPDIAEVVRAAQEKNGPWPELDEPQFTNIPERSNFTERVSLWAAVGILGAITIYAMAKGNEDLLKVVMTIAAATLYRLTRLPPKPPSGERDNDPRPKRRPKKRPPPG